MNKIYIKVALALLGIAGYMQNVAFASETAEQICNKYSLINHGPLAIYEQYKDEACINPYEALEVMKYAVNSRDILAKLSEVDVHDYSTYSTENGHIIYNKKIGNMDIGRLDFTIPSASKYEDVYRHYWDFKYDKTPDKKIINEKVARLYCKNLAVFEKHNPDSNYTPLKKVYTIGSRTYKEDFIVLTFPSRILNFDGEINKETELEEVYRNQKLFELDIDPEEALNKYGDNIVGFVIKSDKDNDQVRVTYINAIYDNGNSTEFADNKRQRAHEYTKILKLAQRIIANDFDYPPREPAQAI
ncbi:fam-a protein [Plasmodium vinckei vinckei]|uniref:Fam-a protein n=1 Tax=Plasmodium vinckei vinckei TaxID=54757 RepID=A0A449BM65_PLAVN|nr:fam-a protein [Plasmodium vinckei vinckei]VEV54540.1 fam-a protein [Plasmodium vinckei vinckei]